MGKFLTSDGEGVQGWIFSPQFITILQIANVANAICSLLRRKSLPRKAYEGRAEVYSDVSIFITALVMRIWRLSLGEVTRRLRLYCHHMWLSSR
jgi:hypothetical protein